LIHGGVALHLPHPFPLHRQTCAQRSRAGSTRRRSRTLEGCDGLECSPLFPSFRRGVLSAHACPCPYCRDALRIRFGTRGNRPKFHSAEFQKYLRAELRWTTYAVRFYLLTSTTLLSLTLTMRVVLLAFALLPSAAFGERCLHFVKQAHLPTFY
jgi:hypothetical protein